MTNFTKGDMVFLICTIAAVLVVIGAVGCYTLPQTTYDALANCENSAKSSDFYYFSYYEPENPLNPYMIHNNIIEMNIPEDVFIDSMKQKTVRVGGTWYDTPIHLVDPDNPYVQHIARQLKELSEGWTDSERATLILNFVQTAISYQSDSVLFGMDEFWATPTETLYLHRGDCEDQAILLCSLYGALGYDWLMLTYPGHISVGLNLYGTLYYCEPTYDTVNEMVKDGLENLHGIPTIHTQRYDCIVENWFVLLSSYR